jgi:uncharacterized ferredoxin-like protein
MLFPLRFRDRGVFLGGVSSSSSNSVSASQGGQRASVGLVQAACGAASFAGPRCGLRMLERPGKLDWANSKIQPGWAGLAGPHEKQKRGRGKKRLAGPD